MPVYEVLQGRDRLELPPVDSAQSAAKVGVAFQIKKTEKKGHLMNNKQKYYAKKRGHTKKPNGKVSSINREELFDRIYQMTIFNVDEMKYWNPLPTPVAA